MEEQIRLFDLLTRDRQLRDEYEHLKAAMNGQSLRDYQEQKYEFYNRVLGLNAAG